MKTIKYYHKNSDIVAYKKEVYGNGYWYERTYDENGNPLTFKNSEGYFGIRGRRVTKEEFEVFVNSSENPVLSKIIELENQLVELKNQLKELKKLIK